MNPEIINLKWSGDYSEGVTIECEFRRNFIENLKTGVAYNKTHVKFKFLLDNIKKEGKWVITERGELNQSELNYIIEEFKKIIPYIPITKNNQNKIITETKKQEPEKEKTTIEAKNTDKENTEQIKKITEDLENKIQKLLNLTEEQVNKITEITTQNNIQINEKINSIEKEIQNLKEKINQIEQVTENLKNNNTEDNNPVLTELEQTMKDFDDASRADIIKMLKEKIENPVENENLIQEEKNFENNFENENPEQTTQITNTNLTLQGIIGNIEGTPKDEETIKQTEELIEKQNQKIEEEKDFENYFKKMKENYPNKQNISIQTAKSFFLDNFKDKKPNDWYGFVKWLKEQNKILDKKGNLFIKIQDD